MDVLRFGMIVLFCFQPIIEEIIEPFKYFDEIIAVAFFLLYLLKIFKKRKINKKEAKILLLLFSLLIVGLCGNMLSKSGQPAKAIAQDIMSNFKLFIFVVSVYSISLSEKSKQKLQDWICRFIRTLIVVLFTCAILTQAVNIGMGADVRYGLISFKFLFPNAAGLNTYFYLYMVLFSITMYKNGKLRKYTTLYACMAVIVWALTLRSRAVAFAALYIVLYYWIIRKGMSKETFKFKWYYLLFGVALVVLLGWSAVEKYFILNEGQARYQLMYISIDIAKDYMPFGTGFGTFGTEASRAYYSSIYVLYGLSSLWGLSKTHPLYITDQYWMGILGQFGVIGVGIVIILLIFLYRKIWAISKDNRAHQLAAITLIYTSLLASIAAATYIQASILMSVYVVFALCDGKTTDSSDCKEAVS